MKRSIEAGMPYLSESLFPCRLVPGASAYKASADGKVMRCDTGKEIAGSVAHGYRKLDLVMDDGSHQTTTVARIVGAAFGLLVDIRDTRYLMHIDNDRGNDALSNLRAMELKDILKVKDEALTRRSRPIIVFAANTGRLVAAYPNEKIAADQLGLKRSNLCNVLKGKSKTIKGYTARYATPDECDKWEGKR
jgi:hypothetical protein